MVVRKVSLWWFALEYHDISRFFGTLGINLSDSHGSATSYPLEMEASSPTELRLHYLADCKCNKSIPIMYNHVKFELNLTRCFVVLSEVLILLVCRKSNWHPSRPKALRDDSSICSFAKALLHLRETNRLAPSACGSGSRPFASLVSVPLCRLWVLMFQNRQQELRSGVDGQETMFISPKHVLKYWLQQYIFHGRKCLQWKKMSTCAACTILPAALIGARITARATIAATLWRGQEMS